MYLLERFISEEETDKIKTLVNSIAPDCPWPNWYSSTVKGTDYHLMDKSDELCDIIPMYEAIMERKLRLRNAWTVYGQEGSYHLIHRHHFSADFICTVLFLDTSGISTPNGDFYAVLNNDVYQYSPQKGDLLIFSSDVCHGTYPQVKGLRHTLNLDFNPL
jgi:hypothetical protein|tara:strand:+ start:314 stop:793 length:480 start_codon:yes stop_codon:yes gene_type:complete